MDVRKIIKRVLSEADEIQNDLESLPNWSGVKNLPASFEGYPLENIVRIKSIPSIENYKADDWFEKPCKEYMRKPNSKFPDLKSCINAQKKSLLDQMSVGGVWSFTWKGQKFQVCSTKSDDKLQFSTFSGYYGVTENGKCYAPEFYDMINQKKSTSKKEAIPGVTSDKTISLIGPDNN